MYYLMCSDESLYPMIHLKQPIQQMSWVNGERLQFTVPLLEFEFEKDTPFQWCDYFRPSANIPLFSEDLKVRFDSFGIDNIDYYEAIITDPVKGDSRPYYAANIIGKILGMDTEKSEYELFDKNMHMAEDISKLVLDEAKFEGVKICRLAEYDLLVVVHSDLKQVIESSGGTGISFIEPEQWESFSC